MVAKVLNRFLRLHLTIDRILNSTEIKPTCFIFIAIKHVRNKEMKKESD